MKWVKALIVAVFAMGMAVFALVDLEISKGLYRPNAFGIFFAKYGEVPGYFLIVASFTTLLTNSKRAVVVVPIIISLLWLDPLVTLFSMVSSLMVARGQEQVRAAKKSLAVAIIHPLLLVQSIKLLWGRKRFRDLISYGEFTPWFLPQGFTGHYSFPSGHTSMGVFLLCYSYFHPRNKKVVFLAVMWGILVAVSRVMVGAHYASDVWFSLFTGILVILHVDSWEKKHHS